MRAPAWRWLGTALMASLVSVPAVAQTSPDPPARRLTTAPPAVGIRAYGFYDRVSLSASESFDAIFGTSSVSGFGAGVDVTDIWQRVFARVAFSSLSFEDGSRAFVIDGQVIPTGVRLDARLRPLELGVGWRQPLSPPGRYVAYGGLSIVRAAFRQTSEFAGFDDDVDETFGGYGLFVGVDALVARAVFVGAEFEYRAIPDAIGMSGVSELFGEDDLGGAAFRILFGVRR